MTDDFRKLLQQALAGAIDLFRLVDEARAQSANDSGLLVELSRHEHELARQAAILAAHWRTEPAVLGALGALASDPSYAVRERLALALQDCPGWPIDAVGEKLLEDLDVNIRVIAARCAAKRPALLPAALRRLREDAYPWARAEIAYALQAAPGPAVVPDLLLRLTEEADLPARQACAGALEVLLRGAGPLPLGPHGPAPDALAEARRWVNSIKQQAPFPVLSAWLDERLVAFVDVRELAQLGTVLTVEAEQGRLPRAHGVDSFVDSALAILRGRPPRALVLLGDPGAGKTAIVHEIAQRLRESSEGPWHMLQMAPTDFLANTKWIGEWETRCTNIVGALRAPRRAVLYVPNLHELSWVGTTSSSNANVASHLAGPIERGELAVIGECTTEAFRKGLGANPSLRRLFHPLDVPAMGPRQTREVLHLVAQEAGARVSDGVLDRLGELAALFAAGAVEPGRSVGLLRRALGGLSVPGGALTEQDVLRTISESTGVSLSLLDDSAALDRAEVREYFEARVMGQPEAVGDVIDLVTLIKAGLTDPGKPYGVLLFVGPTGVGKTELARALAERLFGDPARLLRLDMSEFASYEAFERLIGSRFKPDEPGLLTAAVRERPFMVLLLDEIEKAHANIFNLCLQIFDAGRLTDTQGRTADFRRTIVILTSNVGSAASPEPALGYKSAPAPGPDRDAIMRELGHCFRPEFLNRLDRIVVFQPLARETAEKICRREIARVMERSGITRRRLTVDVSPEALPLLLQEGYSATYGARPLKRTIEKLALLPVARAISEGKAPPGSLLRLIVRGKRIDVEVEAPEAVEAPEPARPAPKALAARERAAALIQAVAALEPRADAAAERKSQRLTQAAEPEVYGDLARLKALHDEVWRLEGVLTGFTDLEKAAKAEADRLERLGAGDRASARLDQRLDELETRRDQVAFLLDCKEPRDLGDVTLSLRLAAQQAGHLEGVHLLAKMYCSFAKRRGLDVEVLDDRKGGELHEDTITLLISGAGAFALLAAEAGLHQVTRGRRETSEGRHKFAERDVVRVEAWPVPLGQAQFREDELKVEIKKLRDVKGRLLAKPKHHVRLFHLATNVTVQAWCQGDKKEFLPRLHGLLRARLDAAQLAADEAARPPALVRRYRLGPTTLVRCPRTGRQTARLDEVLDGRLDMFLALPGAR